MFWGKPHFYIVLDKDDSGNGEKRVGGMSHASCERNASGMSHSRGVANKASFVLLSDEVDNSSHMIVHGHI